MSNDPQKCPHVNAQVPLLWLQQLDSFQKSSQQHMSMEDVEAGARKIGIPADQVHTRRSMTLS